MFENSAVTGYNTSRYGKFGCETVYFLISVFFVQKPHWSLYGSELCSIEHSMESVNVSKSVPLSFVVSYVNFYLQLLPSHYQTCSIHSLFFFIDDFHFPEILMLFPVK